MLRFTWKGQPSQSAYPINTRPQMNAPGPYPSRAQNKPTTVTKLVLATIPRLDVKRNIYLNGSAYYDPKTKGFIYEMKTCTTISTSLPTVCMKKLPRPLKIWRKQLNSVNGVATSKVTLNQLNGNSVTTTSADINHCVYTEIDHLKNTPTRINGKCKAIRRSAGACSKNYCTTTKEYLQKRTKTYDQNQLKGKYIAPYTFTSGEGSESPDVTGVCNKIIIKPSNTAFQEQGGVTSSARTNKLKYKTVMSNTATANYATARATLDTGYINVKSQNQPREKCIYVRQDRVHQTCPRPQ
jgi:hypothetical protein